MVNEHVRLEPLKRENSRSAFNWPIDVLVSLFRYHRISLSAHLDVIFFEFPGPVALKDLSAAARKGVVAQFDFLFPNDCMARLHGEAMSTLFSAQG